MKQQSLFPTLFVTPTDCPNKNCLHSTRIPGQDVHWPERRRKKEIFPSPGFAWLLYQLLCNRSSKEHSHVGSLSTTEEQEKVGAWCNVHFCNTCQLCSWHHRLGQHGSAHGPCFCDFEMSATNFLEHTPTQKICCDVPLFYSCQQDPWCFFALCPL